MKKVLSIVAVVAIVLSLSVCAFADVSKEYGGEATEAIKAAETTATVKTPDGKEVEAKIDVAPVTALPAEEEKALDDALKGVVKPEDEAKTDVQIVDVELKVGDVAVDEDYFKDNEVLTVAFVRDDAAKVTAVLYWNDGTKVWDKADFKVVDGKLSVDFKHLCAVAFVIGETAQTNGGTQPPAKPAGPKGAPGDKPGDPKSPQTGYNTGIWALAAVAMALCAGYCFVARRKVAE